MTFMVSLLEPVNGMIVFNTDQWLNAQNTIEG